MAIQINEVIVRAIITGSENAAGQATSTETVDENISSITKQELLELVDEVLKDRKER
jgi:hypothetical protein